MYLKPRNTFLKLRCACLKGAGAFYCLLSQDSCTENNSTMKYSANLLSAVLIQIYLFMLLLLVPRAEKNNGDIQTRSKNEVDHVAAIGSQWDSQPDVNGWTVTATDAEFGSKKHQGPPLICFLPFVFFQEAIRFYYFKPTDTSHQAPQKFAPFFAHLHSVWENRFSDLFKFLLPCWKGTQIRGDPNWQMCWERHILLRSIRERVSYCSITTTPQWGPSHHWEKGGEWLERYSDRRCNSKSECVNMKNTFLNYPEPSKQVIHRYCIWRIVLRRPVKKSERRKGSMIARPWGLCW